MFFQNSSKLLPDQMASHRKNYIFQIYTLTTKQGFCLAVFICSFLQGYWRICSHWHWHQSA